MTYAWSKSRRTRRRQEFRASAHFHRSLSIRMLSGLRKTNMYNAAARTGQCSRRCGRSSGFESQIWRKHILGYVSAIAKLLGVGRFAIAVPAAAPKHFQFTLKMITVGQIIFATQLLQMPAPKAKLFSHEITQILFLRSRA